MTARSIFSDHGTSAHAIAILGWTLTAVACLVVLVVTILLLVALFRRRTTMDSMVREEGEREGRRWIVTGTVLTIVVLLGTFVYTLVVLTGYASGLKHTSLTIRITGYRYWWAVEYLDPGGAVDFVTANEIHIPAGKRVRLQLESGDVIHSFWVPALGGKTDLIPGQTNQMWIESDTPGHYSGQCAEYCGPSHANMLIQLFVDTPDAFHRWEANQRRHAPIEPATMRLFQTRGCAACHTIGGTGADGKAGPDLTHVGSRTTLATGVLPNTRDAMMRWLREPNAVKPGTLMPNTGLSPEELATMASFLEGLR